MEKPPPTTSLTVDGGVCLWESETHDEMPERAFRDCARLAMGCLGKEQRQREGGIRVVWG